MQIAYLLKNAGLYSEKSPNESLKIIEMYAKQHGVSIEDILKVLLDSNQNK